ncbi:MAG: DUF6427 family protein [Bacteroidales bacterium]|nr:DUF6427 family protein [Bacteroidales bacterium]
MVLRLFRGHDPVTIFFILLTGIAVWLRSLMDPGQIMIVPDCEPMPVYSLLISLFEGRPLLSTIAALVLVFITGALLVNFNTRVFFINERTFLPASLFVLMSGLFPSLQRFNPVLPAVILLLFAIERVIGSYRRQGIAYNYFDASLLIGLASFLWFNSIWFFIVVIAGIAILRTVGIRELFLALSGLVTPYILAAALYYLLDGNIISLIDVVTVNFEAVAPDYIWSPQGIAVASVIGILLIGSIIHLITVFNTKKVKSRKTFSLMIWVFVTALLVFIALPSVSAEIYYFMLLPVVYFLTHFLVFRRNKKTANALFAVILISILVMQVF